MHRRKILSALLVLLPTVVQATPQQINSTYVGNWSVLVADSASIPVAGMQLVARDIFSVWLADSGGGRYTYAAQNSADQGLWAGSASGNQRYFRLGQTGVTGPGRSGAEAGHVFHQRYDSQYYVDVGNDGQRVFLAMAGAPDVSLGQNSNGAWRWNGSSNIEFARNNTSGVLGPALGPDWTIRLFMRLQAARNGSALFDATLIHSGGNEASALIKHVPGQGNTTCVLSGSTNPNYSPNVGALVFGQWHLGLDLRTIDADGRYYAYFDDSSGVREGIWEVCNGPPRAIVMNNEVGARGPGLGSAAATFAFIGTPPIPGAAGKLYFGSSFNLPTGTGTELRQGIFVHDGGSNRPLALQGDVGSLSPNWQGTTFSTFAFNTIAVNRNHLVFNATVGNGSTNYSGMWRIAPGGQPQPVGIVGDTGAYAPPGGLTWKAFYERNVLGNGDIVVRAQTSDNVTALWLIEPGVAPRRILAPGQLVTLQTTSGTATAAVENLSLPSNNTSSTPRHGPGTSMGLDGWVNKDGQLLAQVVLTGYGYAWVTSFPSEHIFRDDFQR